MGDSFRDWLYDFRPLELEEWGPLPSKPNHGDWPFRQMHYGAMERIAYALCTITRERDQWPTVARLLSLRLHGKDYHTLRDVLKAHRFEKLVNSWEAAHELAEVVWGIRPINGNRYQGFAKDVRPQMGNRSSHRKGEHKQGGKSEKLA